MAFGKRSGAPAKKAVVEAPPAPEQESTPKPDIKVVASKEEAKPEPKQEAAPPPKPKGPADPAAEARFAQTKINIFNALIYTVDLTELSKLETAQVREEVREFCADFPVPGINPVAVAADASS